MPQAQRFARLTTPSRLCGNRRVTVALPKGKITAASTRLSFPCHLLNSSIPTCQSHLSSAVSFSTTSFHLKKGAPKAKKITPTSSLDQIPDNTAQSKRDREVDPYDFSDLEAKINKQLDWLRESLRKHQSGGRLSTETIEGFQVELKHGLDKDSGQGKKVEKVRLQDLATVVPRGGRMIAVMVNEPAHLKPITTSIQSSPYSLAPQPDSQNPLQLNVPIPPPTAESRAQSVIDAKKEYEKASTRVRDARAGWQKWYRKAEKERLVIRDELQKAHKKMEAVIEKGYKSLKEVHDQAIRTMER